MSPLPPQITLDLLFDLQEQALKRKEERRLAEQGASTRYLSDDLGDELRVRKFSSSFSNSTGGDTKSQNSTQGAQPENPHLIHRLGSLREICRSRKHSQESYQTYTQRPSLG